MSVLRLTEGQFSQLHRHLFRNNLEQHSFAFASVVADGETFKLLVHDLWLAAPDQILHQSPSAIELSPLYVLAALERCKAESLHLIDIHSHPFCDGGVCFSSIDRRGAEKRQAWHAEKAPEMVSSGLVLGRSSFMGVTRRPGMDWEPMSRLEIIGMRGSAAMTKHRSEAAPTWQDRQIRAFGKEAQGRLSNLKVGVVGLGGTGSLAAIQLAMLGVTRFVLADPDLVEETNLNRLYTADREMIGQAKVEAARRAILRVNPTCQLVLIERPINSYKTRQALAAVDLLVGCVDNDPARIELADLSMRCLIPWLDMGTGINVAEGEVKEAGGQFHFWVPGATCPGCCGGFNVGEVDRASMPKDLRAAFESVYGSPDPAPAVASLNSLVVSAAMNEVILWASDRLARARAGFYDSLKQSMQAILLPPPGGCPLCGRLGIGLEEVRWHRPLPDAEDP